MSEAAAATGRAHARAALLGNPSDGFGGATIAFELRRFAAEVAAEADERVTIEAEATRLEFAHAAALVAAGRSGAYPSGGPAALLMATAKRFAERLAESGVQLDRLGWHLRLPSSSIPPQVGLGGSSAIVIAGLRALCELHRHQIPRERLPGVALACETEELGITAGLQDRVVQACGGLVFMDFAPDGFAARGHGAYEPLDPELLPDLVVAYRRDAGTDSGLTHAVVRERFEAGDSEVAAMMAEVADLAHDGRKALLAGDRARLGRLLDRNFELRRRIYSLDPRHVAMIEVARSVGATANYAGSGGAVVALPAADGGREELAQAFEGAGCVAIAGR